MVRVSESEKSFLDLFRRYFFCAVLRNWLYLFYRVRRADAAALAQMLEQGSKAAANLGKMPPEMREQAAEQLA